MSPVRPNLIGNHRLFIQSVPSASSSLRISTSNSTSCIQGPFMTSQSVISLESSVSMTSTDWFSNMINMILFCCLPHNGTGSSSSESKMRRILANGVGSINFMSIKEFVRFVS
ncbi:unnamed protein product [Cuscuta epithymum]|uniref:Uncharacterized protein n=1 Tax=Cuscuta epithymum TaxID=186058 RepID=A0AAV0CQ75_9ASTE|nr:unnamed protein product [Cuscuta epithymum]